MTATAITAGALLVAVPIGFNVAFGMLAARFDYPDVLRHPTADVLARFRDGGSSLVLLWWAFALAALAMVPLTIALSGVLREASASDALVTATTTVGVLAALVQLLGLIRWPFVVPYLAREAGRPDASEARLEAVDVVFQALNRYLGVAVGEHLGYALTGAWTVLAGAALVEAEALPAGLGVAGLVIGPVLMLCALEFVGPNEQRGWPVAEKLTPVTYVAWSLWLIASGIGLLVGA